MEQAHYSLRSTNILLQVVTAPCRSVTPTPSPKMKKQKSIVNLLWPKQNAKKWDGEIDATIGFGGAPLTGEKGRGPSLFLRPLEISSALERSQTRGHRLQYSSVVTARIVFIQGHALLFFFVTRRGQSSLLSSYTRWLEFRLLTHKKQQ